MNASFLDLLKTTPITDLNLGDVRLRRKISRCGFSNIVEVLSLSDSDIDKRFEWDDADAIIKLKERYERDPEKFAREIVEKQAIDNKRTAEAIQKATSESSSVRHSPTAARQPVRKNLFQGGPMSLPNQPFSDQLLQFEKRAEDEFRSLADQFDNVMAYQAFDTFSTEFDEIEQAFNSLFEHYQNQPRNALALISKFLRNIFLIYVADLARKEYDGSNLWGNLFERIGLTNDNLQGDFKRLFVHQLQQRKMPLYAADEEVNYYFYTALLHGGLSSDSWESLWAKSLLPLAREIAKGDYGFAGEMDGHAILKEIKNPNSKFAPKKSVLNILEKAPDSTIAPLFEASFRVASQVEKANNPASGFTMLTSFGLPDVAMQALRNSKRKQRVISSTPDVNRPAGRHDEESRIVYLPEAKLQLDLAQGLVLLRWNKQQFPMHFAENRIDYYLDDKLMASKDFKISVGKCILDETEITVKPRDRYDVEIKIMAQVDGNWHEIGSLEQSFARSKPECFEFICDSSGLYRLRGKNERLHRTRRIAYVIKKGYDIIPGQGMTPISMLDAAEAWNEAQIALYDVEPGASGSIIDQSTGREIAVWQERYIAKIDKRRIIGETAEGIDLYGFAPCSLGTNGGLPSISIEATDGTTALDDLDIICYCDGNRVSVPRHILWDDNQDGAGPALVSIIPSESAMFDRHIELCEIEAKQRSAGGRVVFRYRFAVVPIQEYRLRAASLEFGTMVADYQFQSVLPVRITNAQGEEHDVATWERYNARTLLKDEFLRLRIESENPEKATDAKLALAAIDVELPKRLLDISKRRPVCLADALQLGPTFGNIKITAFGSRYNRAAMCLLGLLPMFFKTLKRPGQYQFNLFAHLENFVQQNNESPISKPLVLSICYGDDLSERTLKPAWTDIPLLDCKEGVGFSSWRITVKPDGTSYISLDATALIDVQIDFKRTIGGSFVDSIIVPAGSIEAELPQTVVRHLNTRKKLTMTISPVDWLGNPKYGYATDFMMRR